MVDYIVNPDGYLEYLHNPTNSKMPVVAPIEITGGYLIRLIDDQEAILQNLLTEVISLKALEGNTKNVQLISSQATILNSILTQLQGLRSDVQNGGGNGDSINLAPLESLVGTILNDELPLLRQLNTDIRNKIPSGTFPVALNVAQKNLLDNIISLLTSIQTTSNGLGINSDEIITALDEVNSLLLGNNTKITSIDANLQDIATNDFPLLLSKLDTIVTNTQLLLGNGMTNIEEVILDTISSIESNLVYVSPLGDDTNTGVELSPVRTIKKALELLANLTLPTGVKLAPGKYSEACPLIVPRNVAIIGENNQQVVIEPTVATQNNNIMLLDSGSLVSSVTFSGHNNGRFAIALNGNANNTAMGASSNGAYLLKMPCVYNCQVVTSPSGSVIEGTIINSGSAGGAIEVDGNKCATNSPARAIAVYNLKVIALNGEGCLVKNDGQIHLYNCESNFAQYHVKALSGGLALLQENKAHFGTKGLIADGVSPTALFSALLSGSINQTVVQTRSLTSARIGTNKPQPNMILNIEGTLFKIINATAVSGGYDLTLDRPLLSTYSIQSVSFHRASTIISNSQFFHFIGAGNDYRALPENGGASIVENEKEELNNGKIICNSFNSEGDVNINDRIFVNGTTGEVTIDAITVNFPPNPGGFTLYRYNANDRKFSYNDSNTATDGWTNLALSVNPNDITENDFRLLSERISAGGIYQLYVDIDNPSASDKKENRGNSPLRPFRTLERALLEAARRSFSKSDDVYNRVSIYVAPGIYDLNNGFGGATDDTYYNRFQDAATLVLKNRNSIIDLAYQRFTFVPDDSLQLRRRLKEEISYAVNSIAEDLSAMGNRSITNLGRSYVGDRNLSPGDTGFTISNFLGTFYYSLYLDENGTNRSNSLISSLINSFYVVRDEAIKAMRNQGIVIDTSIVVDSQAPVCANVASAIASLIEILTKTLVGEINPYTINVNVGTALRFFTEDDEPNPLALQAFNDPINAGIILPRGVSIVGADLRKVIFRPKYVPSPFNNNSPPSSIFRMTGGNFFQGFTILDQSGKYRGGAPAFSHHKLSAFAFCKNQDLELYYNNVLVAFADRSIYNRSQDGANLLEKNIDWVVSRSIPSIYPLEYERYIEIFSRELRYFLQALIFDLRRLDKHGITAFGNRFRSAHIIPLESQFQLNAQNYYELLFRDTFDSVIDAINNQANPIEGGVRDDRIIIDTSPGLRCSDVVSALANYYDIFVAEIKAEPEVSLIEDRFVVADSEVRDLESNIVIPSNSGNINSVEGASPYIFSASVRSEYGMCGIDGNGADVGGLKSYLAAQFTIISLQRDDRVFIGAAEEVGSLRYKGSRLPDLIEDSGLSDARHFGYRVRNGAYAQLVSCFCICPAVHYWADNGSEFSITNSTSNFGDISLYSEGFLNYAYPQDQDAKLLGLIKPMDLPYVRNPNASFADRFSLGNIASILDLGQNQLKITLSSPAKYLDQYKIDNPDRVSYVYVSSRTVNERRATVQSVSLNQENKTEIVVNITGSPGTWVWTPEREDIDATVISRQLFIKRFVDTRKTIDREYRLIIGRETPLEGKRKPPIHYIIQKKTATGEQQPFSLVKGEVRNCFYVLNIEDTDLLPINDFECYDVQVAAIDRDQLGNIEYDIDLSFSSRIDLDYDPSDPNLLGVLNKNSYSRENIAIFLDKLNITLDINVNNNRIISLDSRNIRLNFNKPSIIRCGGQTWEYMGYYNYSTGIPSQQRKKLGESLSSESQRKILRLNKTQTPLLGGRVYATGMDEEGNSYAGNAIIDLKTQNTEQIIRGTSPEVVAALEEETIDLDPEFNSLIVLNDLTVGGNIIGLPDAEEGTKGIASIARDSDVIAEEDNTMIVTPAKLKRWRVANKLISNNTTTNTIYVSNRTGTKVIDGNNITVSYHSEAEPYYLNSADRLNHGNAVTWSAFRINQNGTDESAFWQLSDPAAPNFRCLSSMQDVANYGNANLTENDILTLRIDPGKYRADYTFNFGININGANGRGANGWGNPDGSDITPDGLNGGIILYTTTSIGGDDLDNVVTVSSRTMVFNSTAATTFAFVHFWTAVTASQDMDTEWKIKAKNENTYNQMLMRANDLFWLENRDSEARTIRSQYNASWQGYNRTRQVVRLRGTGNKKFTHCTFSGQGCSSPTMDRGGTYNYGYIAIYDSCQLFLESIVLRGNEEIRISDKFGRFVTTDVNPTPVLMPPDGYRTLDKWTWAPIYDNSGNLINYYDGNHLAGFFHDPINEELVSVGFCDYFIGVGEGVQLTLFIQGKDFNKSLSSFGYNELIPFASNDKRIDTTFTINNDAHNIRLEKNTPLLFGLEDDRLVTKETSINNAGDGKLYFRGTDNLGRKIRELYPPVLTFTNGQVDVGTITTDWTNWVNDLINQGPMIVTFLRTRLAYELRINDYEIWADRDSPGLILGQGFLGEFGYRPRINNGKLLSIQAETFSGETYGQTITWSTNGTGCKISVDAQYHHNLFRPIWKGFNLGKYQLPVIIDVGGTRYTNLVNELSLNGNDYSIVANDIQPAHTLDGQIVGAMFIIVGANGTQSLSLMYIGYDYVTTGVAPNIIRSRKHKFLLINNTTGVTPYFTAKNQSKIFENLNLLRASNQPVGTTVYVRESNLFLQRVARRSSDIDSSNLRGWIPLNLNPGYAVMHNLANMGLFGNLYRRGSFTDHLGYELNTQTDFRNNASIRDNPELRAGFSAKDRFLGIEITCITSENLVM